MNIAMTPPDLQAIQAWRGVWALGRIDPAPDGSKMRLKRQYVACCVVHGHFPIWAVWTNAGRFTRFYGLRSEIEAAYPRLTWRRQMATWQLAAIDDPSLARRKEILAEKGKLPKRTEVPA